MYQSKLFSKTSKEAPKEETSINAKLLEQAGFVQKVLAGVYNFLPLGNRVLQKIERIIREEMDKVSSEMLMPALQPKENWLETGRWQTLDVLFKIKSAHGFEYALGPTHEEIVAPASKKAIGSYRDLPLSVYQIQTKFRDEARAKSGLLRGREFRMKDMYSFHSNQADLDEYHEKISQAYSATFKRFDLDAILTEASGGSFSKFSYEFQVVLKAGEDTIYICEKCRLAKNKEIFSGFDEQCSNCGKTSWREESASEVGNIFKLGTKYSTPFGISFTDAESKDQVVIMGCYGMGTTRLLGVIAEIFNDENGLVWPKAVAPFMVHLITLGSKDPESLKKNRTVAEKIYAEFQEKGIEVLFDDRDETAGVKFKDADLIGIPWRVLVSEKTLASDSVEIKKRSEKDVKLVAISELQDFSF